ncbi:MAG: radical SAM protein, partial [Parasporobacterium sp.]|nr:radical SAM protein [Parasporobacterium sp.]
MKNCNEYPEIGWVREMRETAVRDGVPIQGTFELTPVCDFNCRMCYVHLTADKVQQAGGLMSADEWIRLGREAVDAGTLWLCITGGEPLMHPEFKRIYRELSQMGFFITIQTNASLITDDIIELFSEFPPFLVKITVYGSNDEIYEKVCGVKDGFTRVDRGIRALKEADIQLELVTTVIKDNLNDLPNIYRYISQFGVKWYYCTSAYPSARGAETDAASAAIDEYDATDFREEIRQLIANPPHRRDKKPCEMCKGYRTGFWVLWDGKMRFCSLMNEPGIDARNQSLENAWKQLLDFEENLKWPEECASCEARDICVDCMGMVNSYSGSI